MTIKQSLNLGDLLINEDVKKTQESATEFRDSLQLIFDKLFEDAHAEIVTNTFVVTRNAAQVSLAGSTPIKILFDTLKVGDAGDFDLPNGRLKPSLLGNYQIMATVELPTLPTTASVFLSIRKNGVEVWKGAQSLISASVSGLITIETIGDYIEIFLEHSDGGSFDTTASQSRLKFAGYKIP